MDLHIERPELNAPNAEQNIATVDSWIADTSEKLNIALTALNTKVSNISTSSSGTSSSGKTTSQGTTDTSILENKVPHLGSYKVETSQLILGG